MKILNLVAENLKRIVAIDITPEGNLVQITGKNGSGKSSTLDAISWAIEGLDNVQAMPIRKGADSAVIIVSLGDASERKLKVTRTFKRKKEGDGVIPSLRVETADGARYSSPQAVLDDLLGALSFDPLAFAKMKPRDQYNELRRLVPGFDFEENAAARKRAFDARTEVNREEKSLRTRAEGFGAFPDDLPLEPIDKAELIAELEAVHETNAGYERMKSARAAAEGALAGRISARDRQVDANKAVEARIAELQKDLQIGIAKLKDMDESIAEAEEAVGAYGDIPDPVDTAEVRAKIRAADDTNVLIARRLDRDVLKARADEEARKADGLTNEIERLDAVKATAVAGAEFPVDGLAFGDGGILLNGVPFEQASDSEQLRTSIAIAGAMNPKLRVIRVRDGSLLDGASMKLLAEYADKHDLQVFVEVVTNGEDVGVVIEEGRVKGAPVEEPAEEGKADEAR